MVKLSETSPLIATLALIYLPGTSSARIDAALVSSHSNQPQHHRHAEGTANSTLSCGWPSSGPSCGTIRLPIGSHFSPLLSPVQRPAKPQHERAPILLDTSLSLEALASARAKAHQSHNCLPSALAHIWGPDMRGRLRARRAQFSLHSTSVRFGSVRFSRPLLRRLNDTAPSPAPALPARKPGAEIKLKLKPKPKPKTENKTPNLKPKTRSQPDARTVGVARGDQFKLTRQI